MTIVSMDFVRLHVFVISTSVSVWTLAQTTAYTAFDKHDHVDICKQFKRNFRMFQHGVPRASGESIVIRGVESITSDTFIATILKNIG